MCHGTKFDIRQWFLVTWHPLTMWLYNDCYLRFSSASFSLEDFDEKIHLTNNAVQGKYFSQIPEGSAIPKECMWRKEQFLNFLSSRGMNGSQLWKRKIFPEISRVLSLAMVASSTEMDMKAVGIRVSILKICLDFWNQVDGYELFGADFILADDLKPWLIEINSGPDLSASTCVTAEMCPRVVIDCVKGWCKLSRDSQANLNLILIKKSLFFLYGLLLIITVVDENNPILRRTRVHNVASIGFFMMAWATFIFVLSFSIELLMTSWLIWIDIASHFSTRSQFLC